LMATIVVSLVVTAVLFLYPSVLPKGITPGFYKVTAVADGDTITVDMNGTLERIRMIGVDTPETHDPNTPVQCYGPEASDFTKQTLLQKTVRLEADPTNDNRDRYNRLLRYVYLEDGSLYEETLISQGYGFAYLSFPFQKTDHFATLQAIAQDEKRGLWAACQPNLKNNRWQSNNIGQ
ncbi:MAG TPA: thermonuclease family protein, partial [Candidatus Saccharimonadales bacterium]|nr:thermonuclease family protein [Candidatus Saccharimonadales bacterium]